MKRRVRFLICTVLIFCITLGFSLVASAVETISKSDKEKLVKVLASTDAGTGEEEYCNKIKLSDGTTFSLFTIKKRGSDDAYWDIEFNDVNFKKLGDRTKEIILQNFEDEIKKSSISDQGKQYIYNEIRYYYDYDTRLIQENVVEKVLPNMFLGYEFVQPAFGVVSTILGCICIVIIMSLVASVILDVMYMQVPVFREKTFQATQRGGGGRFSFIRNRTQLERPWFISYEAAYANKVALESNGTKNALVLYLLYRSVTFIVVSFCIIFLMTGMFMGVVQWIWDKFSPMFAPEIWGAGG